jgi:hypothetical protein
VNSVNDDVATQLPLSQESAQHSDRSIYADSVVPGSFHTWTPVSTPEVHGVDDSQDLGQDSQA